MFKTNKDTLSRISLVSLVLMFCLPFMVSYHRLPESNYYSQTLAFILGVLSLTIFLKRSSGRVSYAPTTFVPIAIAILIIVQWFFGIGTFWQESALGVLYLCWAAMIMLVVGKLKEAYTLETLVTWLAYALFIGGVVNLLVVMMQFIGADDFFWTFPRQRKSYTGNLAQVNLLTDYLALSMTSMFYLYLKGRLKIKVIFILLPLFLIALTLTGSRMSWLYIVMISFGYYIFARGGVAQVLRGKLKWILLLPILYGITQLALPNLINVITLNEVLMPPAPTARVVEFATQSSSRIEMIKEAINISSEHPMLGVGWGQYVWYDLLLADTYNKHTGFVSHTHNLFMQILVECGVFAFLALVVGSVYWFLRAFKKNDSLESVWLLVVVGVLFVHSMLEYPLWYSHFLGVFVVLVALGDKTLMINLIRPAAIKVIAAVMVIASLAVISITTYQYMQIEYWIMNYARLNERGKVLMLNEMSKLHKVTLIAEPLHMVLTRAYSALPAKQAPLKSKIARYENVMHYVQGKEDIYRYVLLLATDGQTEKARVYLKRAYARQPGYASIFERQLQAGVKKGNKDFLALNADLKVLRQQEN